MIAEEDFVSKMISKEIRNRQKKKRIKGKEVFIYFFVLRNQIRINSVKN